MRYSVLTACLLCVLSSCSKSAHIGRDVERNGIVYLSFERSKGLDDGIDSELGRIEVFVYDKNGLLRAQQHVKSPSDGQTVPISVPVGYGVFNVYVLANSTRANLLDIGTEEEFLNTSSLLSESIPEGDDETFVEMLGTIANVTFVSGETYPVSLRRMLAKVRLEKIAIDLPSGYYGWRVMLKSAYLINANIRTDYRMKWDSPVWANKSKWDETGDTVDILLKSEFDYPLLPGETFMTEGCNLYCYPNATTVDSSSPVWCPRYTRLVLEAAFEKMRYSYEEGIIVQEEVVESHLYYYPVNIIGADGKMSPNTAYNITRLTITGPGSDSPDVPIHKGSVSVAMTVADWNEGFRQTVSY